mgnify:CR=1 FL=1
MFWALIGLVCGGLFMFNGFSVLTDPECDTVSFGGGGRVVRITCYAADSYTSGAVSGTVAGLGMLVVGGVILWLVIHNLRARL